MTLPPSLKRTHRGQYGWKQFLGTVKTGEVYILPIAARSGCLAAKQYTSLRFNTVNNYDGTFTLTIIGEQDPRHALLADFANLSTGVLKALHDAATKSGLFPQSQSQS